MPSKTHESPREQIDQLYADNRRALARDVDALLDAAIEEVSHDQALRTFKRLLLEKFDHYLPLRPVGDPLLLQLLNEAYELLNNPESRLDIREWLKVAKPLVTPRPQRADDVIDPRD